jgi:hypothetical protein
MPEVLGCLPQGQHLSVRRGIRQGLPLVVATPNDDIVHDDHSPNRHFRTLQGQARFL